MVNGNLGLFPFTIHRSRFTSDRKVAMDQLSLYSVHPAVQSVPPGAKPPM